MVQAYYVNIPQKHLRTPSKSQSGKKNWCKGDTKEDEVQIRHHHCLRKFLHNGFVHAWSAAHTKLYTVSEIVALRITLSTHQELNLVPEGCHQSGGRRALQKATMCAPCYTCDECDAATCTAQSIIPTQAAYESLHGMQAWHVNASLSLLSAWGASTGGCCIQLHTLKAHVYQAKRNTSGQCCLWRQDDKMPGQVQGVSQV